MAHPDPTRACGLQAVPERAGRAQRQIRGAVFPCLGLSQSPAEVLGQQLHAVANAQHRHAKLQKAGVQGRSVSLAHAGRAAGKDQGRGAQSRHLLGRGHAGVDFGIDPGLAHAAGNELGDLGAVINDDDLAVRHKHSFCEKPWVPPLPARHNPARAGCGILIPAALPIRGTAPLDIAGNSVLCRKEKTVRGHRPLRAVVKM